MFVKPVAGRTVRDPDHNNRVIPPEGLEVRESSFWLRRLGEGDVVLVEQAAKSQKGKA